MPDRFNVNIYRLGLLIMPMEKNAILMLSPPHISTCQHAASSYKYSEVSK